MNSTLNVTGRIQVKNLVAGDTIAVPYNVSDPYAIVLLTVSNTWSGGASFQYVAGDFHLADGDSKHTIMRFDRTQWVTKI